MKCGIKGMWRFAGRESTVQSQVLFKSKCHVRVATIFIMPKVLSLTIKLILDQLLEFRFTIVHTAQKFLKYRWSLHLHESGSTWVPQILGVLRMSYGGNITSGFSRETRSHCFLHAGVFLRSAETTGRRALLLRASESPLEAPSLECLKGTVQFSLSMVFSIHKRSEKIPSVDTKAPYWHLVVF